MEIKDELKGWRRRMDGKDGFQGWRRMDLNDGEEGWI